MRRVVLLASSAILFAAVAVAATEPNRFSLSSGSSSASGDVLSPALACTDDTVPTWDGATNTQLQCSTLLYSTDGDLTATRGVMGKWGLFQPTTDTTSLIARRQGAAQTSYVFQVQTEANAHVLGIGPTGTVTGPSGGFAIVGGTGAPDLLTLDGSLGTAGDATVSAAGRVTVPTGDTGGVLIGQTLLREAGGGVIVTDAAISAYRSITGSHFTATGNIKGEGDVTAGSAGGQLKVGSDTGFVRVAAGVLRVTNGSTGVGVLLFPVLVEANTAGSGAPNVLAATESGTLLTNEGASAQNYHTLPTAAAGLCFEFLVQDADGLRVVANTGDTIRIAGSASAAAGYIQNSTIGGAIRLCAINATEWFATSYVGTWTVDS